jgi:2-isopropylmalate synthase
MSKFPFFEVKEVHYSGTIFLSTGKRDCTVNMKIKIGEDVFLDADEGNGPINAAEKVMKKILKKGYPGIDDIELCDHKTESINVVDDGSRAMVKTTIELQYRGNKTDFISYNHDIVWSGCLALIKGYKSFLEKIKAVSRAA